MFECKIIRHIFKYFQSNSVQATATCVSVLFGWLNAMLCSMGGVVVYYCCSIWNL